MKRLRRWLKRIALGFVVLLVLLVAAWIFRWQLLSGPIRSALLDVLADQGLRIHVEEFSGSLLADVTVTGIRTEATTKRPIVRTGTIERVHVTFSLIGLLRGESDWLGDVEVEGVTAVVDIEAPAPKTSPDRESDPILPRRVLVTGADLTILAGPDRLTVTDGELVADLLSGNDLRGTAGAGRLTAVVDGQSYDLGSPQTTVDFDGETLTVLTAQSKTGAQHEAVRADLSRLDIGHVEATIDLPILGGGIVGTVRSDVTAGKGRVTTADLSLADLRPTVLLRFLPGLEADLERVAGTAHVTVGEVVSPWWMAVEGDFDLRLTRPVVRGWAAEEIEVKGTFDRGMVELASGRVAGPGGTHTTVTGWVRLDGDPTADIRLGLRDFDVAALAIELDGRGLAGRVTGEARAWGSLAAPEFRARLQVDQPGFGEWSADRIDVEGEGDLQSLSSGQLTVTRGEDSVEIRGTAEFGERFEFETSGAVSVASVAKLAAGFDVELPARLDPALKLRFAARSRDDGTTAVDVTDLAVRTGLGTATSKRIESVLPPFDTPFDPGKIAISGTIALTGLSPEEVAGRLDLPDLAAGGLEGELTVSGTVARPVAELTISGEKVEFRPPDRQPIVAERVTVIARLDENGPVLRELFVGGPAWRLQASGALKWNPFADRPGPIEAARLTARVEFVDLPLELTGRIPGIAVAAGRVNALVEVKGSIDTPRAQGTVSLVASEIRPRDEGIPPVTDIDLRIRLAEADTSGLRVVVEPSRATVHGATISIESASAVFAYEGFRLSEPRLSATVKGIDVATLAREYGGIETVGGTIDLDEITLGAGPAITVTARGRDLSFEGEEGFSPIGQPGTLNLRADWRDGRLTVSDARMTKGDIRLDIDADVPIELSLDPPAIHRPPDGKISVTARGTKIDLAPLSSILDLPRGIRIGGSTDFEVVLGGTHRKPEQEIRATLRDGFLRLPGMAPVDEMEGKVRFTGDGVLHVDGLTALLGRGKITIAKGGFVKTSMGTDGPLTIADLELHLSGENVLLVRQRRMLIRGTPDLTLTGNDQAGYLLGGTLDLTSFRYTQRLELVSRQPSLAPLPLTENPFMQRLRLDLELNAPPSSIRIRNNLMDAEMGGRLRIFGTAAVPRPEGRIIADRGLVRLPALTMKLVHARVEFRRERPLQPRIDTRLTTKVNRVTVYLSAEGPVDNLEISTSSLPPLPDEDIISLLATGELPADVDTAASAAGVAATLLYRQIVSEMAGADPDAETTAIEDLASRIEEISVDTAALFGGGGTAWRATVRIIDEWLYLRADQTDSFNFGLDILFRLSFR